MLVKSRCSKPIFTDPHFMQCGSGARSMSMDLVVLELPFVPGFQLRKGEALQRKIPEEGSQHVVEGKNIATTTLPSAQTQGQL
eukprot:6474338-Amphidinium_carterae.2